MAVFNQDTLLKNIFSSIEKALPHLQDKIACFDADGTLWKNDVDFHFLAYQKKRDFLNKEHLEKVQRAHILYNKNSFQACCLLAQRNAGFKLSQLIRWSQDCFKEKQLEVFSFQRDIISFLKKNGVKIYIVSASPEWLVRQALIHHGLEVDEVVGVRTQVKDDLVTDQLEHPLSIGEKKVDAFLNRSLNKKTFFVAGNTLSDLRLLENSTHLKFSIASAKEGERHYESEQKLLNLAQQNAWFHIHL